MNISMLGILGGYICGDTDFKKEFQTLNKVIHIFLKIIMRIHFPKITLASVITHYLHQS